MTTSRLPLHRTGWRARHQMLTAGVAIFLAVATDAAPAVDLAELARNRADWPAVVRLTAAADFPVLLNGREAGSITLPAGTELKLVAVLGEQLRVSHAGAEQTIPAQQTDLVARVQQLRARRSPSTATATAPPVRSAKLTSEQIAAMLDTIILPLLEFRRTPARQALQSLVAASQQANPNGVELPLEIRVAPSRLDREVTLRCERIPLREALRFVTTVADLQFVLSEGTVLVLAKDDPGPVQTRTYHLPAAGLPPNAGDLKRFFTETGVPFPEGSSLTYDRALGRLTVRNGVVNLALLETVLRAMNQSQPPPGSLGAPHLQFRLVRLTKTEGEQLGTMLPWQPEPDPATGARQRKALQWFKTLRGSPAVLAFEIAATSGLNQQTNHTAGTTEMVCSLTPTLAPNGTCDLILMCDVTTRNLAAQFAGTYLIPPGETALVPAHVQTDRSTGGPPRANEVYLLVVTYLRSRAVQ